MQQLAARGALQLGLTVFRKEVLKAEPQQLETALQLLPLEALLQQAETDEAETDGVLQKLATGLGLQILELESVSESDKDGPLKQAHADGEVQQSGVGTPLQAGEPDEALQRLEPTPTLQALEVLMML